MALMWQMVKRIWNKLITTEPVIYLDLFKGIVLLGGATGFFIIDDTKYQAISAALGIFLPTLLTWLTRSSVYSQRTVNQIESIRNYGTIANSSGLQKPLDKS